MSSIEATTPAPEELADHELVDRLQSFYKQSRNGKFHFGCGGYSPFLQVNGNVSGCMFDFMQQVAHELKVEPVPVRHQQSWTGLFEELNKKHIETIADPIIASVERPFHIVPYAGISSCTFLYDHEVENPVNECAKAVRRYFNELKSIPASADDNAQRQAISRFRAQARKDLTKLISGRKGIAVTAGVLEEYFLRFLGVHVAQRMDSADIIDNSMKAAKEGFLVFADKPSVKQVLEQLRQSGQDYYQEKSLFEDIPFRAWAGFAFRPEDELLQEYFIRLCKKQEGRARKCIDQLPQNQLSDMQIDILSPQAIPRQPIETGIVAAFWLLQATPMQSSSLSSAGAARLSLLTEGSGVVSVRDQAVQVEPSSDLLNTTETERKAEFSKASLLLAVTLAVMVAAKGLASGVVLPLLALACGITFGVMLIREGNVTTKGALSRVCFSIAGLLLIYETISVLAAALAKNGR